MLALTIAYKASRKLCTRLIACHASECEGRSKDQENMTADISAQEHISMRQHYEQIQDEGNC